MNSPSSAPLHESVQRPSSPVGGEINYDLFLDCVHCGLCTAACPTYLETGDENNSPRGRIYLMRAVVDGRLELNAQVARPLEQCLDCRSCETACPSGVQYGRLIEPFRVGMHQQEKTSFVASPVNWLQRQILGQLFPYASRLRWALWPAKMMQQTGIDGLLSRIGVMRLLPEFLFRMHALLPPLSKSLPPLPAVLPAIGAKRATVGLFTGCVADAMFRRVHWATARVLQMNGCEVVTPSGQGCCGAIHYHSGAGEPAMDLVRQNARAFGDRNLDAVILNVAGCGAMLKELPHTTQEVLPNDHALHHLAAEFAAKVKDIHEFLVELGPIPPQHPVNATVTYHDACHLAHAQKIKSAPRQLLELIPGLTLVPLAESDICCGAAGSYNLTEGAMADRLGVRKRERIEETNAQIVASANAGCTLQMMAKLKESGSAVQVLHPMELLDQSYRGMGGSQ